MYECLFVYVYLSCFENNPNSISDGFSSHNNVMKDR